MDVRTSPSSAAARHRAAPADALFLLAFAVGSGVSFLGGWWLWPLAALFVGVVSRSRAFVAALGLAAAAVSWAMLEGGLAPPPAFEGPDYNLLYGTPLLAAGSLIALWVGGFVLPRDAAAVTPARARIRPAHVARAAGILAIAVTAVTFATEAVVPSRRSFDLPLPAGWVEPPIVHGTGYYDPTYGAHYTAVRGASTDFPRASGPPSVPTLGVTVIRAPYRPTECILSVHGWTSASVPTYQWPVVANSDVQLPVGNSHRVVRMLADGSARLYGWGITRVRRVGALEEPLCYMLILTTPAAASLTDADADAIASSFRFR